MELVKWYLQSMFWVNGMLITQVLSLTKKKRSLASPINCCVAYV